MATWMAEIFAIRRKTRRQHRKIVRFDTIFPAQFKSDSPQRYSSRSQTLAQIATKTALTSSHTLRTYKIAVITLCTGPGPGCLCVFLWIRHKWWRKHMVSSSGDRAAGFHPKGIGGLGFWQSVQNIRINNPPKSFTDINVWKESWINTRVGVIWWQ